MSEPDASEQKVFRFMDLPVEVRRMIWKECLPSRVMEIDGMLWLRARICHLVSSGNINRKLPAITHVCAESRAVVYENGHWEPMAANWGKNVWWNPERDLVFQHWKPLDNLVVWGEDDDLAPDLLKYNGRARGLGVVAERIRPFYPSGNCDRDTYAQGPEWLSYEIDHFRQSRDWWLSMDMVVLHVSEDAARRSGLFGLLGDAPVQLVDVFDTKRIAQFQEFATSASPEDADTQGFFSRLGEFQERVRVWSEELESVWVYNDWFEAFINYFEGVHQPWDIWLGPVHKARKPRPNKLRSSDLAVPDPDSVHSGRNIDLSRFWLNRDHPFVKESLAAFPRFHLQVMFRCCPEDCYSDKRWEASSWGICQGDTDGCLRPIHPHLYRRRVG